MGIALAVLASDNYKWHGFVDANDFIVCAQLNLAVTDDGSLAPTFTYMQNPMFSFSAGAKYEISRHRHLPPVCSFL